MNIRVPDHLIVGGRQIYSFAEHGLLVLHEIISKRRAMTIYRQHPESRIFRYCTGKYQWHGASYRQGRSDIAGVTRCRTPNRIAGTCSACLMSIT